MPAYRATSCSISRVTFARARSSHRDRATAVWNSVGLASRSRSTAARPAAKSASGTWAYSRRTPCDVRRVARRLRGQDRQVGVAEHLPGVVVVGRPVVGGEPHQPADLVRPGDRPRAESTASRRGAGPRRRRCPRRPRRGTTPRAAPPRGRVAVGQQLVDVLEDLGEVQQVVVAAAGVAVRLLELPATTRAVSTGQCRARSDMRPSLAGSTYGAPSSGGRVGGVQHGQRRHRAGQADVEPPQPGDPVGLARHDPGRLDAGPRGRTPVPWPATRVRRRAAPRTRRARSARRRAPRARRRPRSTRPRRWRAEASGVISPTEPTRARPWPRRARPGRPTRSSTRSTVSSPRARRTDVGGSSPGAIAGSSRAAYSMTSPGTRKPLVSCSMCASGLPRWPQRVLPGAGRPRGGGLGEVAEHGGRAGRAAPSDGPQHHRRQVLRLVGDHVPERRASAPPGRRPRR